MTTIFISHAKEDAACAEQISQGLEAQGYSVRGEPTSLSLESLLYPRTIENLILGSATVLLLWSSSAAQSEWVERHMLFAQRLKKPIVPVLLDATALPNTLLPEKTIISQTPCTHAVAQLVKELPSAASTDSLLVLCEQATNERISLRKEAIDAAAGMLQRGEQREAVLALLEYLAHNDLMLGVREKAQEVLDAEARKALPPPPAQQSRHVFGAKCRNGHISYFDKQQVCGRQAEIVRRITQRASTELDELDLKCKECGVKVTVHVDCGGYRR